jgi:hypothetical protein
VPGPEPADAVVRCPDCDSEVIAPGRFCVRCGVAVGDAAASAAVPGGGHPDDPADLTEGLATSEAPGERPEAALRLELPSEGLPLPASGRGATLRCPNCGQVNARARELCQACGLDLDPSDRTSVPVRTGEWTPPRPTLRRRLRGWWLAPVAALLVIAAVTAALAWLQAGPFASPEEPLAVVPFPAERYPAPAGSIELADIGTLTSAEPDGDRVFLPDRMVDDDPATAWRGDAPALPDGLQETVDVALAEPAWIRALVIANGDHLDASAYEASGRVQRLELWVDGDLSVAVTLLDLGRQHQVVTLPDPLLTTALRLVLVDVRPGVVHPEPAISTLTLRGHVADPEDAALARDRAEQRPAMRALVTDRRPAATAWWGQGS